MLCLSNPLANLDEDSKVAVRFQSCWKISMCMLVKRKMVKVYTWKGFGDRKLASEMLLEFANSRELIIVNTFFQKNAAKLVTNEAGDSKMYSAAQVVRRCNRVESQAK